MIDRPYVFISHASENYERALQIVQQIEKRGISCWITPRNLAGGMAYDDEIALAITNSEAVLVIFSNLCNQSDYVRREVTFAGEKKKRIIPFRIEKDAMPEKGLGVRLLDLHWIDGCGAGAHAIDEAVRAVRDPGAVPTKRPNNSLGL